MEQQIAFEATCERYLLGELSEAEQAQLEESYFADDALFERFLAVKDELLDAYARDELTPEKRARFEQHFRATAPRRQQIAEAKDLVGAATAVAKKIILTNGEPRTVTHTASPSWRESVAGLLGRRPLAWQFALALLLLLAVAGVWTLIRYRQRQAVELARGESATPQPPLTSSPPTVAASITPSPAKSGTPQPAPKRPDIPAPQFPSTQIASITLLPVATRDVNEENTLVLDPVTRIVRLRLVFRKDNYRSYSAKLSTLDDRLVWQASGLKADSGKSVTVELAPGLLRRQDYLLTLDGRTAAGQLETIATYYFHVVRH